MIHSLTRMLRIECFKLRLGLTLPALVLVPILVAALFGVGGLWTRPVEDLPRLVRGSVGLWSGFMAPMSAAAVALAMARVEHLGRGWDVLFTGLPSPHMALAAKFFAGTLACVAMCGLFHLAAFGSTLAVLQGRGLAGSFAALMDPWIQVMVWASLALAPSFVVTLWLALRLRNPVPAMLLASISSVVALAGQRVDWLEWFPWSMASRIATQEDDAVTTGLKALALAGVLAGLAVMDLARRGRYLTA